MFGNFKGRTNKYLEDLLITATVYFTPTFYTNECLRRISFIRSFTVKVYNLRVVCVLERRRNVPWSRSAHAFTKWTSLLTTEGKKHDHRTWTFIPQERQKRDKLEHITRTEQYIQGTQKQNTKKRTAISFIFSFMIFMIFIIYYLVQRTDFNKFKLIVNVIFNMQHHESDACKTTKQRTFTSPNRCCYSTLQNKMSAILLYRNIKMEKAHENNSVA